MFDAWQNSWTHSWIHSFMVEHDEIPVAFIVLYLFLVFGVPDHIKTLPTEKYIRMPMMAWNWLLSIFSGIGLYYMWPQWWAQLSNKGVFGVVCQPAKEQGFLGGAPGFWLLLFVLSKIPEAVDTVWLVLQKKPVILLHGWHHTTVALYCWHSYIHLVPNGPCFAVLNYAIHTIMYAYFALYGIRFPPLRKSLQALAPVITALQLVQMFAGMFFLAAQRYYNAYQGDLGIKCDMHRSNNLMGLLMYLSYAILFGVLFRDKYCAGICGQAPSDDAAGAAKKRGGTKAVAAAGRSSVRKTDVDDDLCNATAKAMTEMHGSDPHGEKMKTQ